MANIIRKIQQQYPQLVHVAMQATQNNKTQPSNTDYNYLFLTHVDMHASIFTP